MKFTITLSDEVGDVLFKEEVEVTEEVLRGGRAGKFIEDQAGQLKGELKVKVTTLLEAMEVESHLLYQGVWSRISEAIRACLKKRRI